MTDENKKEGLDVSVGAVTPIDGQAKRSELIDEVDLVQQIIDKKAPTAAVIALLYGARATTRSDREALARLERELRETRAQLEAERLRRTVAEVSLDNATPSWAAIILAFSNIPLSGYALVKRTDHSFILWGIGAGATVAALLMLPKKPLSNPFVKEGKK